MALAEAGCIVDAVCPPRHPIAKTQAARHTYTYRGLAPLMSLANAIRSSNPDFIVPGDDLSTRHLHHLYRREQSRGAEGATMCARIERSLGSAESFPIVYARAAFMQLAQEEGIRVPKTAAVKNLDELRQWATEMGLPVVLKADGTSGGDGVRIAHTTEESENAFRTLQAPPLLARAAKRALMDRDKTLVWPSLLRRHFAVSVQALVSGREATSTVACWKGAVLAGLHFEVVHKRYSTGPATVMRLIDHPEMAAAVEKIVRRLNLSGMQGFDFMIEAGTGNAYLIEINPRTTQVGHLALGPGRDLPAALCAAVSGSSVEPAQKVTEKDTIALFPQEWIRDPASPFLSSAYHDVPWEAPELMRACVQRGRKQTALKTQQSWDRTPSPVRAPIADRSKSNFAKP